MKAAMTAVVQRNKAAWELFRKAASCERSRYPVDFGEGVSMLMPHLVRVKTMAQWGKVATLVYADDKKSQEAANAILVSLACANSPKQEPALVSQLVVIASYAIVLDGLEWTLSKSPFGAVDLERLSQALAKLDAEVSTGTSFWRAYAAERAMTLDFAAKPLSEQQALNKEVKIGLTFPPGLTDEQFQKYSKAQSAYINETYSRFLRDRRQPFPERLAAANYVDARLSEAKTNGLGQGAMDMLSPLVNCANRELRILNKIRLARIGVALEQFRLGNGNKFPDSISELSPGYLSSVPVDPFNGQNFNYRKDRRGYKLFGNNPQWLEASNPRLQKANSFAVTFSAVER
jgi:hypothetical protein